jgi:hypothetical protein
MDGGVTEKQLADEHKANFGSYQDYCRNVKEIVSCCNQCSVSRSHYS